MYSEASSEEVVDLRGQDELNEQLKEEERQLIAQWVAFVVLLLLLTGLFLFIAFYPNHARNESFGHLQRELSRVIGELYQAIAINVLYIQEELANLRQFLTGSAAPPTVTAPPESLYFANQSGLVYFETAGSWALVFNNSMSGGNSSCSACPAVNATQVFVGPWNATIVYQPGNIVTYNEDLFITETFNNTNNIPGFNNTVWIPYVGNITGVPGAQGAAGPPGPQGVDLVADGNWNATQPYVPGSVVVANGTLFVSSDNNTGAFPPTSPSDWAGVLTNITLPPGAKGATGDQGPPGLNVTFVGPWNSTFNYTIGQVVIYNNTIYTSLVTNNTNIPPNTNVTVWLPDLSGLTGIPGADGTNGTAGESFVFVGPWAAPTPYVPGDAVLYGGSLFSANASSTGQAPNTSVAVWNIAVPPMIDPPGRDGANGTVGPQGPSVQFVGNWNSSASYVPLDLVLYNQSAYEAVSGSTNVLPGSNSSVWQLVLPVFNGAMGAGGLNGTNGRNYYLVGAWNASFAYLGGVDYVVYNNFLFFALLSNQNTVPGSNVSAWSQVTFNTPTANGTQGTTGINGTDGLSYAYEGLWNASQSYGVRNYVVLNGTLYLALNASLNQSPPASPAAWQVVFAPIVGPAGQQGPPGGAGAPGLNKTFEGFWNASQSYSPGNIVLYQGAVWQAVNASIGSTPSNTSAVWMLRIPDLTGGITGAVGNQGPAGQNGTAPVYVGIWKVGTTYTALDVVVYNQSAYIALTTSLGATPNLNATAWQFLLGPPAGIPGVQGPNGLDGTDGISYVFVGVWNATQLYQPGNAVVLSDGTLYTATQNNTNQYPVSNPTFWTERWGNITGIQGLPGNNGSNVVFVGTWQTNIGYVPGDVVIHNNLIYLALQSSFDSLPENNPSVWQLRVGVTQAVGQQGPPGLNAPNNGAQTIRILSQGPVFSSNGGITFDPLQFTGVYNSYFDSTSGINWGNFSIPYYQSPPQQATQLVMRSQVAVRLNLVEGPVISMFLRVDMVGFMTNGSATSATIGTTAGYQWPNTGTNSSIPTNTTYSYIGVIDFQCLIIGTLSFPTTLQTNAGCTAVQTGSDSFVAVDYPTGAVSNTNVFLSPAIDMTQPFYFRFTYSLSALNNANCFSHPGFCTGQALYSTHTAEILEFIRPF